MLSLSERMQAWFIRMGESNTFGAHTFTREVAQLEAENNSLRQLHTAQMEENERLWAIRDSLDDLLEPDEPHDLGGPHISIPWVIAKFDALKEVDDAD